MTDVKLVVSSAGDKESLNYDILIGEEKVGSATVYLASEEEVEAFRKKLKKQLKAGEAYTVKIFLDEKYSPKKTDLLLIRGSFLLKYPNCDSSKILFARAEGDKIVPLTDGRKLEESEIGTS